MRTILTYLVISAIVYLVSNQTEESEDLHFLWSDTDARFDCVVGIAAEGEVIGTGVFISMDTVLTSANVVEDYVDQLEKLQVHTVGPLRNESVFRTVGCIVSAFGKDINRKTSPFWLQHGPQEAKENSPLHDLYTLSLDPLETDMVTEINVVAVVNKGDYEKPVADRYPFMASMLYETDYIETDHYMWAGFGYLNENHLKYSWMEMEDYGIKEVLEDCDEWIPREWGRFLCIENINVGLGVASGAPLFFRGKLVGIGSFMVEKNMQSVLVFTDLRDYVRGMQVCVNQGRLRNTSALEHGIVDYAEVYEKEGKDAKRLAYN